MPAEPVLARALSNTRPLSPACVMSASHRGHRGRISRRLEAESAGPPLQAVIAHLPGGGLGQKGQPQDTASSGLTRGDRDLIASELAKAGGMSDRYKHGY